MFEGVKNIIFDLGGVIINIDYYNTIKAFEQLGIENAEVLYSQHNQTDLFDLLETGKISPTEFYSQLRKITGTKATDQQLQQAWNAMLLDFPQNIIDTLKKAKQKYKTFLLSNTNEIHYDEYTNRLKKQFGIKSLDFLFDKTYLSHQIGLRKPNKEAFELILNENNLQPEETLFIDDSLQHIEGASKVRLKTHWLKDNNLTKFLISNKLI
jgi:HAD superfamily hydrolase (TIGR01509 family)